MQVNIKLTNYALRTLLHTHVHTITCVHTHTCMHKHTHAHKHTHTHAHKHAYTQTYTQTCIHMHTNKRIHTRKQTCIHTPTHIQNTHTHTHTHTHSPKNWVTFLGERAPPLVFLLLSAGPCLSGLSTVEGKVHLDKFLWSLVGELVGWENEQGIQGGRRDFKRFPGPPLGGVRIHSCMQIFTM